MIYNLDFNLPCYVLDLALINALPSHAGDGPEISTCTLHSTRTDERWKINYIYSMLFVI